MLSRHPSSMVFVGALIVLSSLFGISPAKADEKVAERSDDILRQIGAQIEQHSVVRAEFVQTRQMAALKRPLVTRGRLVISATRGVLWQIEQPFRITYAFGESQIVEIGSDGVGRVREAREVPGLAQISRVFRAMLGADAGALREYFDVAAKGHSGAWTIELKPRQAQLAQFLSGMRLSGGRFVDEIRISEAAGDSSRIVFQNSQGAAALNPDELALFGGNAANAAAGVKDSGQ